MKVLLTTVALAAALAATPALARTYHGSATTAYDAYDAAYGASEYGPDYGPAYGGPNGYYAGPSGYVVGGSPIVTFEGRIVGQDPDIGVRQQLMKDPGGVAQ
jgi:hypothetical protein